MEIVMIPAGSAAKIPPAKDGGVLAPHSRLTSLLPPNVVLPTSAVSLVGMYRAALARSYSAMQVRPSPSISPFRGPHSEAP